MEACREPEEPTLNREEPGHWTESRPGLLLALSLAALLIWAATMILCLSLAAGRWDVPAFWLYTGLIMAMNVVIVPVLYKRSPGLIAERIRPAGHDLDHLSVALLTLLMVAQWIVAGLDVGRYHWTDAMPLSIRILGFCVAVLGYAFLSWSLLANPFFSSAVRIQSDRGQYVISTGPYRVVRHPGYSGGLLFYFGTALALGSWLALAPWVLMTAGLVRRTILEDRMLRTGLDGYADYAQRVRYRLVPGLW